MTNKRKTKRWLMVRSDLYGPFNSLLRTFIIFALPPDWFVLLLRLIVFIYLFILGKFIPCSIQESCEVCERQLSCRPLCPFKQINYTTHEVRCGRKHGHPHDYLQSATIQPANASEMSLSIQYTYLLSYIFNNLICMLINLVCTIPEDLP